VAGREWHHGKVSVNGVPPDARAVVDRAAAAIVVVDADCNVSLWNEAAERMFGWPAADVLGAPPPNIPEELRAEHQAVLERSVDGRLVSIVSRRLRREGTAFHVRVDTSCVVEGGEVTGWISVFHEAEQPSESREQEDDGGSLISRLTEVMVDINAELDLTAVFDRIAQSLTELTGADAAGFVLIEGDTLRLVSMVDFPDERLHYEADLATSLFGELLRSGKKVMLATDDTRSLDDLIWSDLEGLHTIALGVSNVHGRPCGALYALYSNRAVGNTEIELLELLAGHAGVALGNALTYQEMARKRGHERAVFEASADGIAVLDARGRIRRWNRVAAELTGRDLQDVLDRRPFFPIPVPHGDPVTHRLPNGRWMEILSQEIPETGEWVVDFRDVTDAKAVEEEKDFFLATASHELRTPITVVRGYAETLERRWDKLDDASRRSAVATIADRSATLARLVDNLFLGTPEGTGDFPMAQSKFDLCAVLREATTAFESLSEKHEVLLDAPETLPPVAGDPTATDLILGQILENAVKYSPLGGRILVEASVAGPHVAVVVADPGKGIRPEDRERVFDRFVQGEGGDRRPFGGIGLGLYIARRLARLQGGDVTAHPNTPQGTRMRIVLMRADDEVEQTAG
jgi:two-component system, NtrC family, sensor histidine kinase KinB